MSDEVKIKVCKHCGYEGPVEEFANKKRICKKCVSAYNKEYSAQWRAENKEKIKIDKAAAFQKRQAVLLANRVVAVVTEKTCSKCGEVQPIDSFYTGSRTCKACKKVKDTEYRERNAPRIKELNDAWVAANSERSSELKYLWTINNPEKVRESQRAHYKAYPEKAAQHHRSRRARQAGIPGKHTPSDITALLIAQDSKCVYCGCDISQGFEVDHKIPVVCEGSSDWPENLQLLCTFCNRSKGPKSEADFIAYRKKLGLVVYAEAA